ncbi:MAG TPA: hypothetical protein VIM71_10135 [Lacunisphaera sp.]
MKLNNLKSWWRSLPPKTRVKWIASMLLLFTGTEILVLAPAIIELAVLIDAFGLLFVVTAVRASLAASLMHLWTCRRMALQPFQTVFRAADVVADFGHKLPDAWLAGYVAFDVQAARMVRSAGLAVLCFALVRTAVRTSA